MNSRIQTTSFATDVLKLAGGNVFAQGLNFALMPLITRFFAPDVFGLAGLFSSIIGILYVIVCLRYEVTIVLTKTDAEAANLTIVSLICVLFVTSLIVMSVYFGAEDISRLLKTPEIKEYLWWIPISCIVAGIFKTFSYWISRKSRFGLLSIANVSNTSVSQGVKIIAGLTGFVSAWALIVGIVIGRFFSLMVLVGKIWREDRHLFFSKVRVFSLMDGFKRYKKFPLISIWAVLLNSASQQLPFLLLAIFFTPVVVGYYALGRAAFALPSRLIGQAIGQIFFRKAAADYVEKEDLSVFLHRLLGHMVGIGIFPTLLLMIIGKELFIVLFGFRWSEAGVYAQILSLWFFVVFVFSAVSSLVIVFERQDAELLFNIILFLSRALCLTVGGLIGNARVMIFLFACTGIVNVMWLFWLLNKAQFEAKRLLADLSMILKYGLPQLIFIVYAKSNWELGERSLLFIGLVSAVIYYFFVIRRYTELRNFIGTAYFRLRNIVK